MVLDPFICAIVPGWLFLSWMVLDPFICPRSSNEEGQSPPWRCVRRCCRLWFLFWCERSRTIGPSVDSSFGAASFVVQDRRKPLFAGLEKKDDPFFGGPIKSTTTMTMTLQQQAQQSALCFVNSDDNSVAPHWNTNDWPPLFGGWRSSHASVVLYHPEQDDNAQTVVVLGGDKQGQGYTNSVLLLNLSEQNKQWQEGPPLNRKRAYHAAVVCSGGVYVIGGHNGSSTFGTIERIDVENLWHAGASVAEFSPTTRLWWNLQLID